MSAAPTATMPAGALTGSSLGFVVCERCRQVARLAAAVPTARCPRCGGRVATRKPGSLAQASAFLIAAAILYVPANVLPIMTTATVIHTESDTIMSGVLALIRSGSWPLGALVFFASIVVPLMKLLALAVLIAGAARGRTASPLPATRLYRLVEYVGRWSMLDIFAVTLLVGLVQVQSLATIEPGGGAVAFGAVVVLTMLSALSFDPRLIWDRAGPGAPASPPRTAVAGHAPDLSAEAAHAGPA